MVFESVVTDVLNKVLGSYIEDLDTRQLRLGIWGGDVVLTNLALKQSALKELDLPIQTVYGRLNKLILKIPWKNIYSAPVEATVEGLYVLIEPNAQVEYDPEKEASKQLLSKQKQLANIERMNKQETVDTGKKVDATFIEKLTTQIVKNVQVTIKDIHVRYEDKITNPEAPFAMGITLSKLCVLTTDENFVAAILKDDKITKIYKMVQLQGLAVYWNSCSELYREFDYDKLMSQLHADIATKAATPEHYNYILGPIHSSARVKLNPRPDLDPEPFVVPKVITNWEMEKLSLAISKDQYHDIIGFADSMELMIQGEPYRKYRPSVPYKGHAKEWWRFAINCIMEFEVQRRANNWSWQHMLNHRQMCVTYAELYRKKLQQKKPIPEVETELNNLERKLDVFNILLTRKKIQLEQEKLEQQPQPAKRQGKSWFSGWWGKSDDGKSEDDPTENLISKFQAAMTPEEKQRLFTAIDYEENSGPMQHPASFVDMIFAFVLQTLEFRIYNSWGDVINAELSCVKCKLETRTSASGLAVHTNINELSILGANQDGYVPKVVTSSREEDGTLLDVLFENNPLNSPAKIKLAVSIKPLRIIYDSVTVNSCVDLFQTPSSSALEQIQVGVSTTIGNVKLQSTAGMQHMVDKHTQIDVSIDVHAPYVIVPYGGRYTETENVLALNLGHAKFVSVAHQRMSIVQKQTLCETPEDFMKLFMKETYDRYMLQFRDLQLMLVPGDEDVYAILRRSTRTVFHILNPVSVNFDLYQCLIDNDPRFPKTKLVGNLPSLEIQVSDMQIVLLAGLVSSIKFPSDQLETSSRISDKSLRRHSSTTIQFFDFNDKEVQTVFDTLDDVPQAVPTNQEFTMVDLNFVVKEFCVMIHHQEYMNSLAEQVASIKLRSLGVDVQMKTYVQVVNVKLRDMNVDKYHNGKYISMISTPGSTTENNLFEIGFTKADKKAPDFTTVYKNCESAVIVNFHSIWIRIHQEALTDLIKYGTEIQLQLDETLPKTESNRSIIARQISNLSEGVSRNSINVLPKKNKAVLHGSTNQTILFKLETNLKEFKIILANNAMDFTSLTINNIMAQFIMKTAYTEISAALKDINLMDLSPNTKYFNLLSVLSDEVINFKLKLYNKANDTARGADMEAYLSLGCIRYVFLNFYISQVINFVNSLHRAREAIIQASKAAADKAKQNVTTLYQNEIQIYMKVDVRAPQVIVPERSSSLDAVMLDLGHLTVSNNFMELNVKNERNQNAVIDNMELMLTDVQMSRIKLNDKLEIVNRMTVLEPITVSLLVNRNLSSSWYKALAQIDCSGSIDAIKVVLGEADSDVIIGIIFGNLSEVEPPPPDIPSRPIEIEKISVTGSRRTERLAGLIDIQQAQEEESATTFLKFNLVMKSFQIKLQSIDNPSKDPGGFQFRRTNLARFSLEGFSVKGRIYTNNVIHVAVLLVDCLLVDERPGKETELNKMFSRAYERDEEGDNEFHSMVDAVFQRRGLSSYLDLKVSGFDMILSMEFISKLIAFFMTEESKVMPDTTMYQRSAPVQFEDSSNLDMQPFNSITFNLKLEKPDIILVEHLNNINTNALIFNCELVMKVRMTGDQHVINGTAVKIQLYTCCYNPVLRAASKKTVIFPFSVVVAGTTPEDKGLHIEVCLTEIRIKVSPATIELLNSAYVTMFNIQKDSYQEIETLNDLTGLWQPTPFNETQFWFFRTELASEAVESLATGIPLLKDEICVFQLPLLFITIEIGEQESTLPVLIFESHLMGQIKDWNSNMSIDATATVQMAYYNSKIAVWEPLIEPVGTLMGTETVYKPWELKMDVSMNTIEKEDPQTDGDLEMIQEQRRPKMSIAFSSGNSLEMTVSKTTLEVVTNLTRSFANAVAFTELNRAKKATPPYRLLNYSGFTVKINCEKGSFNIYQNMLAKEVVLEDRAELPLQHRDVDENKLTLKQIVGNLHVLDKFLYFTVIDLDQEIKLNLLRSDSRYFALERKEANGTLGMVITTVFEENCYKVILSSIIKLYNHLHVPVDVYYMTPSGNELQRFGTIPPDDDFYVPIPAVYTSTGEIFFSVPNYSISNQPFIWKQLHQNVNQTQMLQCVPVDPSIDHKEAFNLKVISSIEQIYNENTIKRTMNSILCNVHIHSPLLFRNSLPYEITLTVQNVEIEETIQPGCTIIVCNATPGISSIVVRLPNYLEKEWSCSREIPSNPPQLSVWTFDSYDSTLKVALDLGVHSLEDSGPLLMTLYCPFWMINKSDLNIAYRSSDENLNILHHPASFKGIILFSFNAKNFFGKKKAAIKIENGGEWSDKFSIDVAGSSGTIICKLDEKIYQFGVNIQLTYNGLTKQVTITPYYVLINNAPFAVECQEHDRPADPWTRVEPNSCSALWPVGDFDNKLLRMRIFGSPGLSPPFYITESHTTLLKLENKYGGIHVDTQITEGAIYITFSKYESGMSPALLMNNTRNTLNIWEKDTVRLIKLSPGSQMFYTWQNPAGSRVLCWEAGYGKEVEDDLRKDGCGDYDIEENNHVYWTSFLNGMQRTLLFTCSANVAANAQSSQILAKMDMEILLSVFGLGLSLVNNNRKQEVMYLAVASSGIIWETCKLSSQRYKQMTSKESAAMEEAYQRYLFLKASSREEDIDRDTRMVIDAKTEVDFEELRMIKPTTRKIRRTFLTGLWIHMMSNNYLLQLHAKVNRVQIDNQIYDCMFPVVLAPVNLAKSVVGTEVHKPFAELSVVKMLIQHSQIKQYKYFKILIQEFHIKLEMGFIMALSEIFQLSQDTLEKEKENFLQDTELVNQPLFLHVSQQSQQEQKSFYDLLHFSPLKVHVSFSLGGGALQDVAPNVVTVLLQSLGVTLTDMQDVIFRIAYFEREYTFLTQKQLVNEAMSHYIGQAVKQLYALVLGLDVLGNPYGLVLGITQGVEDLFYEPFQGAIQGPGEFAEGLALGVRSLFGHTVGGAAGAVSRITGAMGKGIAALTFDKEYQKKRRDAANRTTTSVSEGFARSGKGLVMGVFDGVTGIVRKPIAGAKEQGIGGFFKGLGKGAVGLVARPTSGVVDFASTSLETVKKVTELTSEEVNRIRPSRYIYPDGLVRPYNKYEACGHKILLELEKGKYASTDMYMFHVFIISKKELLMLTDKRILYLNYSDIFGFYQADWSYTWTDITLPPTLTPKGIQILLTGEKRKKKGNIFGGTDGGKTVLITDPAVAKVVHDKIINVQKVHGM